MLRRDVLIAGAGAAFAAAPAAHARNATPAKVSLRMKWLPQSSFAGYYVAKNKGYYLQEGLDLHIHPGGPNLLTENLVATGADTFGVAGGSESVLAARDKGLPLVCVGMGHQLTPFVFVARKASGIKTLADLRGKKVTAWLTGSHLVLQGMLANQGITDVAIQPQQVSITPFLEGHVDVIVASHANELLHIRKKLGAENLVTFVAEDHGVSFPRDALVVTETTAKDKPELVKAFLRATIRGWQDVKQDPQGGLDTVMKIAPTLERWHQEEGLREAMRLMTAGQAAQHGLFHLDMAAIGKAHALLLASNAIQKPVDLKALFRPEFLSALPATARMA